MSLMNDLRTHARALKTETLALYLAGRDPRVPWYAKLLAAAIVAYALSPIDLVPDFIPILGYLDDLIIIPLGIAAVLRMIPTEVMDDCRARAQVEFDGKRPVSRSAAAVIIILWILGAVLTGWVAYRVLLFEA
jgi:uncharacterized membrane protein YkvA (DUF1232 family)